MTHGAASRGRPGDWSDELGLAVRLADAADSTSLTHYLSEELRTTHKTDGTPVSQVDLDTEQAMFDVVRSVRPGDSAIGEEIGPRPGDPARRWIFDGIDGTHNFALGRPGWATSIALEVDGEVVVAVVSAPALGRRWWATHGGGAWTSASGDADGAIDGASGAATQLRVGTHRVFADALVLVVPWEGFLIGWRNKVAQRFPLPTTLRSQCLVLDAVMVASGDADVTLLTLGSIWDLGGPRLIVEEAGGVFRDAWGGARMDTQTGVFTNAALLDEALAELAKLRPPGPDRPRLSRTVSNPIGTPDEIALDGWRAFGIRPMQSMSARRHVEVAAPEVLNIVDERAAELDRPLVGVTTDGRLRSGLRSASAGAVDTRPIADAALAFLQSLSPAQRERAMFAADAIERRMWINVHMNHFRHGVLLEDLAPPERERALDLVRATMSTRGFDHARAIMRLNELLAELTGDFDAFGEWPYFVSIFGDPGGDEPWSWQIDGHHLCVNAAIVDGRVVLTPTFMGAEPRRVRSGPYAGISLFDPEEQLGLDLIRAFDGDQRRRAIIHPSLHPDDIPVHLQNLFDGRMLAGAFHDNLVAPYQGVAGTDMTDAQRRILLDLAATYVGWGSARYAEVQLGEVAAHLDETWFSWYGGYDDSAPFYYRVHSPVLLVEFDHHPGVALDNEVPSRFHVHTVVRTPNGGDYGADLLALHHERFDHRPTP